MNNELLSFSKPGENIIHPTVITGKNTEFGEGVEIGAYSVIGDNVRIGSNTVIKAHVIIESGTVIGEDCQIYHGAVIGSDSQDLKSGHETSFVIIGDKNIIREYVTVNRSSVPGGKTVIGNNNLFMAYSHIAHDCRVGDNNVFANSVNLGGHVTLENNIVIGGLTGVHQFVRIASYSMIGGLTRVNQDIPPYFTTLGNPALVKGVNITGLKRNNFSKEKILILKKAHNMIYNSGMKLTQALSELENYLHFEEIEYLLKFFKTTGKRGIAGLALKKENE